MEREIIVKGEGEVRVMPDRASVRVVIDGEGAQRDDAYAAAAPSANAVDAVLAEAGDAIGRTTTTALMVQPKTRYRKGEQVRTGWKASRTSVIEVVGLDALGDLLAKITIAGGAVFGPAWELDIENPAYTEARRRAAADARNRAIAYGDALGLTIGSIAWISEPGLRRSSRGAPTEMAGMARAGMAVMSVAAEDTIDVSPEEITVRAAVEVGFCIAG